MDDLDDPMLLTNVMNLNNGVLRRRDHPRSRATFDALDRSGALIRVLPGVYVDAALITSRRTRFAAALATSPGVVPSELALMVPVFDGSAGQGTRRRVVRSSVDNPWSGGERLLHSLLRRHRITGWVANAELVIDGFRYFPDVLFEEAGLVVEFDGYEVHSKPEVFESDRRRQNVLTMGDYRVLRYTWKQLNDEPLVMIGQVRTLLARQSAVLRAASHFSASRRESGDNRDACAAR